MTSLDVRKVIGSSPISSTKKKTHPNGWVFLFGMVLEIGLEPISMRQSGGLSLAGCGIAEHSKFSE